MKRIFAIANQKGGVGKTSTAVNMVAGLAAAEKSVLLIDFDPQGNATTGFGIEKNQSIYTIYDALANRCTLAQAIQSPSAPYLHVAPSTPDLVGAAIELVKMARREYRLKDILKEVVDANGYDYIVIDCPPSLGLLTVNALVAADAVIVPLQCEFYAMEGISQLVQTIEIIQKKLHKNLTIDGVLLTMHDGRTNLSEHVATEIRNYFGERVFDTVIPRNIRIAESPSFGKPVLWYDVRCKGAQAYIRFTHEFIQRQQQLVSLSPST